MFVMEGAKCPETALKLLSFFPFKNKNHRFCCPFLRYSSQFSDLANLTNVQPRFNSLNQYLMFTNESEKSPETASMFLCFYPFKNKNYRFCCPFVRSSHQFGDMADITNVRLRFNSFNQHLMLIIEGEESPGMASKLLWFFPKKRRWKIAPETSAKFLINKTTQRIYVKF